MAELKWSRVWSAVADELGVSWGAGLERLITEDVVRFATVKALVDQDVAAVDIEVEWRRQGVPDAVDLVVTKNPRAAIEFKFPREPRESNAAWTQHLGEVLKDFYRLAHMPQDFDERWCVQLISPRMQRYLTGVNDRHGVAIAHRPGHPTQLRPVEVTGLPMTARRSLLRWLGPEAQAIRALCVGSYAVGDHHLVVHDVRRAGE